MSKPLVVISRCVRAKAHTLIWDNNCIKAMQVALQKMPNLDSTIRREALVLLCKVEQLMYTPENGKYASLATVEIMSNFLKFW